MCWLVGRVWLSAVLVEMTKTDDPLIDAGFRWFSDGVLMFCCLCAVVSVSMSSVYVFSDGGFD